MHQNGAGQAEDGEQEADDSACPAMHEIDEAHQNR